MVDDGTTAGWRYRTTAMRDSEEGDKETIEEHLDQWAKAGWELVSANAVQFVIVKSDEVVSFPGRSYPTYSTSEMRHYFYWKKRAGV
jgi:hypothetical protein